MKLSLFVSTVLTSTALAAPHRSRADPQDIWNTNNFRNLVAFGDSYTDENRLNYIFTNNGTYPPPSTFLPESFDTSGGGRTWPRYVIQYTGSTVNDQWDPYMELYDYAVGGAVCSNEITPRTAIPGVLFPSVLEYEVPTYIADKTTVRDGTTDPYFTITPSASNSIYALWIGTNDLGVNAFLTDSQIPGKTLSDYTNCVYAVFDALYDSGARVFVLMNNAPLELSPLYANATLNGTTASNSVYWPEKPENSTAPAEQIREYTTTVNNVFRYQTPFEALVANRYPEASWALFDVHSLMGEIYSNPTQYLNGTEPANVTGFENHCDNSRQNCVLEYGGQSPDSFFWFDQLHPSEQVDRIIAMNFVEVMNGTSTYATYY